LAPRADLSQEGYTFDKATRVLRVRHTQSRDVDVHGLASEPIPQFVDFDNPHVGANIPLRGEYPSGVIDWGNGEWKVCAPGGLMSTFSLCAADSKGSRATFRFAFPRTLMSLDVYNPTDHEVTLTLRAPEMREVTFHLKPEELQRVKTGWMNRASAVSVESGSPELCALRFDNLAYSSYLWARLNWSE
jgi:hypothetical protein